VATGHLYSQLLREVNGLQPTFILWKEAKIRGDFDPSFLDGAYGVAFVDGAVTLNFNKIWKAIGWAGEEQFIDFVCETSAHETLHALGMAHDGIYRAVDHFSHWLAQPLRFDQLVRNEEAKDRGKSNV
jgi:hypothetical protein